MKTPFMWAGSKDKNWIDIRSYIPAKFDRYVEPFVGGGSVYFRLLASRPDMQCSIADVNVDLRNCYEHLRDSYEFISTNLPPMKCKKTFSEFVSLPSVVGREGAMRFLYLNRNRFFGLGGWMNADRYARDTVLERIKFFGPRMKNTTVLSDAFDIKLKPTDFVFCDPPYPKTNNKACYEIDDDAVLDINLRYLRLVSDAGCPFLFITKNVPPVLEMSNQLGLHHDVKRWTFRRPGKDVQLSEELWIKRVPLKDEFDFS